MYTNKPIAINRLTGTLFGQESYNRGIDWEAVETSQATKIPPGAFGSGEFGDTASTVAAGMARKGPISKPWSTTKIKEDDFPALRNSERE